MIVTGILAALIAGLFVLAIRHMLKHGTCENCSGCCSHCSGCKTQAGTKEQH